MRLNRTTIRAITASVAMRWQARKVSRPPKARELFGALLVLLFFGWAAVITSEATFVWTYCEIVSVVCVFTGVAIESAIDLLKIKGTEESKKRWKVFAALVLILGLGLDVPAAMHAAVTIASLDEKVAAEDAKVAADDLAVSTLISKSEWRSIPNPNSLVAGLERLGPQRVDIFICDVGTEPHVLASSLYDACASAKFTVRLWGVSPESVGIFPADIWVNTLQGSDEQTVGAAKEIVELLQAQNLPASTANWPQFTRKDLDLDGEAFDAVLLYTTNGEVGAGLFTPDRTWHGNKAAPIRIMVGERR